MDVLNIFQSVRIQSALNFEQLFSNFARQDTSYFTEINIAGIKISEPVTASTDLLLSIVCLYCFLKLRKTRSSIPTVKLFSYYFLTLSIATAYGGIVGHAFIYLLSFGWKLPAWIISMVSVALYERAAIIHAYPLLRKGTGRFFSIFNVVELMVMLTVVIITQNFVYVELHAAYGLLFIVFSFELYVYLRTGENGSRTILFAVGVSAMAAVVHVARITPHRWFNHLDLSHILMMIAVYLYYRGSKKIHEDHHQPGRLSDQSVS
jgi:hypothetical protein